MPDLLLAFWPNLRELLVKSDVVCTATTLPESGPFVCIALVRV